MNLKDKKIILGISGGIAAYKTCDVVRIMKKNGADIHVVMTKAATNFITPLTMQTLSENPVHYEMFNLISESKIGHISLADMADLTLIAPASADIIAKSAHGICDDLLSTIINATTSPVVFFPSMNSNMWKNSITQRNVSILKKHGYDIIDPEEGELACGYVGKGRLPEPENIVRYIKEHLKEDFYCKKNLYNA